MAQILVHGKDETEHDQRLEAVLKRLVEAGQPGQRQMPVQHRQSQVPWTCYKFQWN